MIHTFHATNNAVYLYGADVDWTQIQHIGHMTVWLDNSNIDCYVDRGVIYFKHERDRTMFLLRWAEAEALP